MPKPLSAKPLSFDYEPRDIYRRSREAETSAEQLATDVAACIIFHFYDAAFETLKHPNMNANAHLPPLRQARYDLLRAGKGARIVHHLADEPPGLLDRKRYAELVDKILCRREVDVEATTDEGLKPRDVAHIRGNKVFLRKLRAFKTQPLAPICR